MAGWLGFYALFFIYAATNTTGFLVIDHANLMFHEAGHAVFGWAGYYTQILGGTIGELLVPLLCTLVFIRRGETTAVALLRVLDVRELSLHRGVHGGRAPIGAAACRQR